MDERAKKRFFNSVIGMTSKQFWDCMNLLHTRAYALGQKHMIEAMECTLPKSKVEAVKLKSIEIRELWDGLKIVTVDADDAHLELLVSEEMEREKRGTA